MLRKDFKNTTFSFSFSEEKRYPHEHFVAGIAPYTRGIYASMYVKNPLEITTEIPLSLQVISPKSSSDLEELMTSALEKGQQHIEQELQKGNNIDTILSNMVLELPDLPIFDSIVFAKSIRTIWAKTAMTFQPKNKEATTLKMMLKITEMDISKAMTGVFCGVQYLRILDNIAFGKEDYEYFLEEEFQLMKIIDPWGGNNYIEEKVNDLLLKFNFYEQKNNPSE